MLDDIILPKYSRNEENFNMISHIVGLVLAVIALILAVYMAYNRGTTISVVSAIIYGVCMIILYSMSSLYHGMRNETAKKIFRVLDHCSIYLMIAGTYTPFSLVLLMPNYPVFAWTIFAVIWICTILGIILTVIDMKRFSKIGTFIYLIMGWFGIVAIVPIFRSLHNYGIILLVLGGILYTIGAVLYKLGKNKNIQYMHGVFHIFVILGSVSHFFCILLFVLPNKYPIF